MSILAGEKISKKFDKQVILSEVSFTINANERIGLVGRNGSGKTTLFELMAGLMDADDGAVTKSKACKIDYVEQEKTDYLDYTLFEYVAGARKDLLDKRSEISSVEQELVHNPGNSIALEKLGRLQHEFETDGGFSFENEIKLILTGLGFIVERHQERLQNFSGGEKNRAGLARALAGNGTLLLLDEPTNHLDIESTKWLEDYLSSVASACIIISHDRSFLNATVKKVWEIQFGKIDVYVGSFDKFIVERQKRMDLADHRYRHQQEEIKRIEDFVQRNMAGQKTKQAQSKLKYLNRIKRLAPARSDDHSDHIKMESSGRSFAHVLTIENVFLGYGREMVVEDVSLDIYRGDKIGLIGKNGSGKTTILKALVGELAPVSGEIRLGNNVDVAYFDQELTDLNTEMTAIDAVWEKEPMAESGKIRSYLARYGFSGDSVFKPVKALSGGEKTKLSLARLLYHPANFIIFDEPTNHLDIDSRETLEQALSEYDGSCLIVSHDRYFLDRVVNKVLHLENRFVRTYDGNYSYFAEKQALFNATITERPKEKAGKQSYLAFKEKSKIKARHKKQIQTLRDNIAKHEVELEKLSKEIQTEISTNDWELLQKKTERKATVEETLLNQYHELEKLEKVEFD